MKYHYTLVQTWGTVHCLYCGELATKLDMAPPKTRAADAIRRKIALLSAPCCEDCSRILSGVNSPFLGTRASFVAEQIWERNKHIMMQKPFEREKLIELTKQYKADESHPVHYQLELWRRYDFAELAAARMKEI